MAILATTLLFVATGLATAQATDAAGTSAGPATAVEPEALEDGSAAASVATQAAAPSGGLGSATGRLLATLATASVFAGGLVAVGTFVFIQRALSGKGPELRSLAGLVRVGALAVFAGTIVDLIAKTVATSGGSGATIDIGNLQTTISGSQGIAAALLIVASVSLYGAAQTSSRRQTTSHMPSLRVATVSSATAVPLSVGAAVHPPYPPIVPTPQASGVTELDRPQLGWVGAIAFALAFAFAGSSTTTGPAALMWFVGFVHVAAAAIWVGGLVAMAATLQFRRQRGLSSRATAMVLGFSIDAGVAAAAVGVSGAIMAWLMVAEPADFIATDWGRLILVKLALTMVAGVIGLVNRIKLVPALEQRHDEPQISAELARTARTEIAVVAIAVLAAAVATSLL
ncbi:MAG: CopD family protein [Acidimicrobiales bacterium]